MDAWWYMTHPGPQACRQSLQSFLRGGSSKKAGNPGLIFIRKGPVIFAKFVCNKFNAIIIHYHQGAIVLSSIRIESPYSVQLMMGQDRMGRYFLSREGRKTFSVFRVSGIFFNIKFMCS